MKEELKTRYSCSTDLGSAGTRVLNACCGVLFRYGPLMRGPAGDTVKLSISFLITILLITFSLHAAHRPSGKTIDWQADGELDFCPNTANYDFRNAYWMGAISDYSYLEPETVKQLIETPRLQKITIERRDRKGRLWAKNEVSGLGWNGHFDFFSSKPILPRRFKSTVGNVLALVGQNLPYEACIKREKTNCQKSRKGAIERYPIDSNGVPCENKKDKLILEPKRLSNVKKLAKGLPLNNHERAIAIADKQYIEATLAVTDKNGDASYRSMGRPGSNPVLLANSKIDSGRINYDDPYFEMSCEKFKFSKDLPPDVQAYWLDSPQVLILSFRGTERDNPLDWATDMATSFQMEHDFLPLWERNVHKGFQNAYMILSGWLSEEINDFFERYPNASEIPVFLTGHSMGGAIATIVTTALLERNTKVPFHQRLNLQSLYTFGAPRIGGLPFAHYFETLSSFHNLGVYRIVNKNDVVTKSPCIDYHHFGTHIQLLSGQQGDFPAENLQVLANPSSNDHNVCAYGSALIDSLDHFDQYSDEHIMKSYFSALLRSRNELRKTLKTQAQDYIFRNAGNDAQNNPYRYPESCRRQRIYRPEAPAYLQLNYRHLPFRIEQ